eukprot:4708519-Karenia_brevis.AAC.1
MPSSRKRTASLGASPLRNGAGFSTNAAHPTWGKRVTGKSSICRSDPYSMPDGALMHLPPPPSSPPPLPKGPAVGGLVGDQEAPKE